MRRNRRGPGNVARAGKAERRRLDERKALRLLLLVFAGFLVAIGGGFWLLQNMAPAPIGGPFRLTAGDGRVVTDRDFRGNYLLIYFGYTYCPDVCPTTLQSVAVALDRLGPKSAKIQPLFVTVDPARDTPALLAQYPAAFSPRLLGLSGTPDEIAAIEREYRIYAAIHRGGSTGYTVDHSSALFLMGPDGRFVASLPADMAGPDLATAIARDLS